MKKKEKKVKRTSLITSIIIYSVLYIFILILGGNIIHTQLETNRKLANFYEKEESKDEKRTEELFEKQSEYSKSLEKLKKAKEEKETLLKELKSLKEKEGEKAKKIEDLDKQISAYKPEKETLEKNKRLVKNEFDKVNKEFIELNEKYQESLKVN